MPKLQNLIEKTDNLVRNNIYVIIGGMLVGAYIGSTIAASKNYNAGYFEGISEALSHSVNTK